jgi:hypothetical protein
MPEHEHPSTATPATTGAPAIALGPSFSPTQKREEPVFDDYDQPVRTLERPIRSVSDATDSWSSLEEALNDLASYGWELQCPVYAGRQDSSPSKLQGVIMVHGQSDQVNDLERRITRQRAAIATAEAELATLKPESLERQKGERHLKAMSGFLETLLQRKVERAG